ncbi:16S rRNA (cytosine(1402)-N(4))-methyltransferase RsmH [Lentisphaerota bacterium WC36G]|nr:16S rRNA (cytosine(1402)-N(4))-methyltransferase RsmH [Lentisphaerae bacterium WC36]
MFCDNNNSEYSHVAVLPNETVENLIAQERTNDPLRIIDGTLGCGGHSKLILERCPNAQLIGIDRDEEALFRSAQTLAFAEDRVNFYRGDYSQMADFAQQNSWDKVDAILLDIGISSPQIDDPSRGFSIRFAGPLDMRMDRRKELTASRIVNNYSFEELRDIFRFYGEIKGANKLANAVIHEREVSPFTQTDQLVGLCEKTLKKTRKNAPPVATMVFQALRIAVNDELGELERSLKTAHNLLAPQGRLAVISFHSLEDRIVKNYFKEQNTECICPPGLPVCVCNHKRTMKTLRNKPFVATAEECAQNSRAKCAKLRVAEKL